MITMFADVEISAKWTYGSEAPPASQPYLTRLYWIIDDGVSDPLIEKCHLIEVPAVIPVHDGSLRGAGRVSLGAALTEFAEDLGTVDRIVTFNWAHHRQVLDHAFAYRLSWPKREWPDPQCAMLAAGKLAKIEKKRRSEMHNMTSGETKDSGIQFVRFEVAAAASGFPLRPELQPTLAGQRRVWAARKIWMDYLDHAEAPKHQRHGDQHSDDEH